MPSLRTIREAVLQWCFPFPCIRCQATSEQRPVCSSCFHQLPWLDLKQACQQCALPLPELSKGHTPLCVLCLNQSRSFDKTMALFHYESPIKDCIQKLKFSKQFWVASMLKQFWQNQDWANMPLPEILVPIPLHPRRLWSRGYNQSMYLAETLSQVISIPLLQPAWSRRVRHTRSQHRLSRVARKHNLQEAFQLHPRVAGYQHVGVVDDVFTTGETVEAFSKALKNLGVRQVTIFCVARA